MNDMNTSAELSVREIQAALDAGPTDGVWQWHSDEAMYECSEAERMALEWEDRPGAIIETDNGFYGPDEPTRAYIAACNPANMRNVLALIQSQAAEIERMREAGKRFSAAVYYLLEQGLNIDIDETAFNFKADGKEIANINLGDLKRELDAILATTQPKG